MFRNKKRIEALEEDVKWLKYELREMAKIVDLQQRELEEGKKPKYFG